MRIETSKRTPRSVAPDACEQAPGSRRSLRRRHRGGRGAEEDLHRRDAQRGELPRSCYFESLEFPDPVISIAIEPKTTADMDKLARPPWRGSLRKIRPSSRGSVDEETGQTIISGMGELHLRDHHRPTASRIRCPCQRGQAAGRLQARTITAFRLRSSRSSLHQADRRLGRLRCREARSLSGRARVPGFSFENAIQGWSGSEGVHSRRAAAGCDEACAESGAIRRLPGGRRAGEAARRAQPTTRTPQSARSRLLASIAMKEGLTTAPARFCSSR